jgi:hypothetical protein
MDQGKGDLLFIGFILAATLFNLSSAGQWFYIEGWTSVIRAAALGLAAVGIFVLSYRAGAGELTIPKKCAFLAAFGLFLISHSMGLLLVDVMVATTFAMAAYVIGGGTLPWRVAAVLLTIFTALHQGKDEMRAEYWQRDAYKPVQIYDYPGFIEKWIDYGFEAGTYASRQVDSSKVEFSVARSRGGASYALSSGRSLK